MDLILPQTNLNCNKNDKNIELVLLFGNTNLRNIFMQA